MAKRRSRGPSADHEQRLAACRAAMKKLGAPAFLLTSETDYFYATGFTCEESAVMITTRDVYIITDRRFEDQVVIDCPWAKVVMRSGLINPEVGALCKKLRIKTLALQGDAVSLSTRDDLKKHLRGVKLVTAGPVFSVQRACKSSDEVKAMNKALRVAEDAFRATIETIRPGQTEAELAARIEYEMKCRGASAPAFGTICAEGPNSALPHARPGKRKVKKGSAILFDWGARVGGYCSDLTRVVFVGSIAPKWRRVYELVLEAQMAAIDAIKPGRRMNEIDAVARQLIDETGFKGKFSHGLGHGLGLDVHERPSLSWRSDEELIPGMLVTVEPGVYLPGFGGVRIEDDILVTSGGHRVLSKLDKSLDAAVI